MDGSRVPAAPVSRYLQRPLRSYADLLRRRAATAMPDDQCAGRTFEQHLAATGVVRRSYGPPCACDDACAAPAVPHAPVNGAVYAGGGNGPAGHGTTPVRAAAAPDPLAGHRHAPTWSGPTFKADRPVLANFVAALAANPRDAAAITAGYIDVHPRLAVRLVAKALAAQPGQADKIVAAARGKKAFGLSWLAVLALVVAQVFGFERGAEAVPREGEPGEPRDAAAEAGAWRTLWAATAAVALVAAATQMSAATEAAAQTVAGGETGTAAAAHDPAAAAPHYDVLASASTTGAHRTAVAADGHAHANIDEAAAPLLTADALFEAAKPAEPARTGATESPSGAPAPAATAAAAATHGEALPPILARHDDAAAVAEPTSPHDHPLDGNRLPWFHTAPDDGHADLGWPEFFARLWQEAFDAAPPGGEWMEHVDTPREALVALHELHERREERAAARDAAEAQLAIADVLDDAPLPGALPPPQMLHHWLAEHGFGPDNPPALELLPPVLAQVLIEQRQADPV